MNCQRWTKFAFLPVMIALLTPAWALDEKVAPDSMPTSSVCALLPAETTVTMRAFYVAATGRDSNPGTAHSPWRTIQHAARSVKAGDTVYIRDGVYHESVYIRVSGSAAAGPVTFQSYPGEHAILDGTGLTPPADNIRGLINIENESYVTVRGLEIRNYQTTNAAATPAGIWVAGRGSHIQILNNLVHDIGTAVEASGNALGIAVYGTKSTALDSITISDNQLHDLKTGSAKSVTVNGNVTNFAINCNIIHDADNIGIAAGGFDGIAVDPAFDYAHNGTISRNTLYNLTAKKNPAEHNGYNADGISVDGGSQLTIESNLLYNVDIGIEITSHQKGQTAHDVTARNNLVYRTNSACITIGGYDRGVGGADHCTIVNNTLFQNDTGKTGSGEFAIQYYATNNVFKNNIVSANSQGLFINDYTKEGPEPADLDDNLYFSPLSGASAEFVWRGQDHEDFSTYQAAAGKDQHSSYSDRKFLNLATIDPRVRPASLAVNPGGVSDAGAIGNMDFVAENGRLAAWLEDNEEIPFAIPSRLLPGASLLIPAGFDEKAVPDSMRTSSVCALPPAETTVTTRTFYVAATGSDSNPGTVDSPWRTIQHAADSVDAGETVYIRDGVYHESVEIRVSGSAAAGPVTFQSYPGEHAILDGTDLTPPADNVRGLINIENESYVNVRGLEIRNYQTTNAAATPAGIWVAGRGSHIQILNNLIHDIGTAVEGSGNALGIAVYGTESTALDSITISDNQLHDLKTGSAKSVTVNGNVTNFAINCNIIHDVDNIGIAADGFDGIAVDPAFDYVHHGTISRNTLYNLTAKKNPAEHNGYNADGISVDSGSQLTIESNLLYNVDIGIEITSHQKGQTAHDVIARNNLVYRANSAGITIGGYDRSVGGADHCTIVDNTLFQNDTGKTGSGEFAIQYYATNNLFKNNIVSANSQGLFINDYTKEGPQPADLDYNLYFSPLSGSPAEFVWRGQQHEGFSTYQAAAGRDQHSRYADRKFLNLATIDPRVRPASLAVNPGGVSDTGAIGNLDFVAENGRLAALLENNKEVPNAVGSRRLPYVLPDAGFYANVAQVIGHDSFARYGGALYLSVGYDFGGALEVESGFPFFFLSTTNISTVADATHLSYRYSSFGDAFVKILVRPFVKLNYQPTLTLTAPTGTRNISTGQPTWDWNNRLENNWRHFHPFGEFVLGNVPSVTPRLESFRISGFGAQVHAGNSFDFGKLGSFDASFYESVPLGNAAAYFVDTAAGAPSTSYNLLSDHGFNGDFSKSAGRVAFDVTYNHSIAHSADAIYVTLSYRIGHLRKERVR